MKENKQKEYIGSGSIKNIGRVINEFSSKRIFLVTGRNSFSQSGAQKKIETLLRGKTILRFSDFKTNPNLKDIKKGIKKFKNFSPDIVIAVGGGSVIDMAKSINVLSFQKEDPKSYIIGKKNIDKSGISLIAVPTTSGSGSEATHFAVVYIDKMKYSLSHSNMLPSVSIVDPDFTMTLPPEITANTGADAFSQAVESFWSVQSTKESKRYAKKAMMLIWRNLKDAVISPTVKSREVMSRAAHLAGKAINISKTTACHAFSYPFTTHFGLAHGQAVALTLAPVLLYNSQIKKNDVNDIRGLVYVKKTMNEIIEMIDANGFLDAGKRINSLFTDIGLKTKLSELGAVNLGLILKEISMERLKNNPRKITMVDVKKILESIL